MSAVFDHYNPAALKQRLDASDEVTRELMIEIIDKGCTRLPSFSQSEKTTKLTRLIDAEAWADAALLLLKLELPLWQVRRIVYDDGEWYCALSRERELPEWLDQSIEARHSNLTLALLCAFAEAQALAAVTTKPSVPCVPRAVDPLWVPVCCDNFS
jgi:hypothetical protein